MNEVNEKTEIVSSHSIKSILWRMNTERKEKLIMNKEYCYAAVILFSLLVAVIQPARATIYLTLDGWEDEAGDPLAVGTWDGVTATLTEDVFETIQIDISGTESQPVVLDGAGHTVSGGTSGYGIYLHGRTRVTIIDVTVEGFQYGIFVQGSAAQHVTDNTVTNNTIHGSLSAGIRLDFCSGNSVTGNTVSHCTEGFGILLYRSSDHLGGGAPPPGNTVTGNTVSNNGRGIYLQYASNNEIYHNNFIDNYTHAQADDTNISGNVFNLASPIGGNYWGEVVGAPYLIYDKLGNHVAQDNLPWTEQDGWLAEEQDILDFFDDAVADGTLVGRGALPAVAEFRLDLMRALLEIADALIVEGQVDFARFLLELAYDFTDGQPQPMDLVQGDAAPELATRIQALMDSL